MCGARCFCRAHLKAPLQCWSPSAVDIAWAHLCECHYRYLWQNNKHTMIALLIDVTTGFPRGTICKLIEARHSRDQCLTAYSFIYFLAGAIAAEDTDGLTKWGPIAVVVLVLLACAAFAGTIVLLSGGPGGDPPPLGRKGCAAAVIGERQVRHNSPRSEML